MTPHLDSYRTIDRNRIYDQLSSPEAEFDMIKRHIRGIVHMHMCRKDNFLDKDD